MESFILTILAKFADKIVIVHEGQRLELELPLFSPLVWAFIVFVISMGIFWFYDAQKKKNKESHFFSLIGKEGIISICEGKKGSLYFYQVKIAGEIWKANSLKEFQVNDSCKVKEFNEETLTLKLE